MGFGPAGTSFCWDGVNDIGFYITYLSSTVTTTNGWAGGFWRTSTFPTRSYAAGYQTAMSSTCNASSGLKMKLDFNGCGGQPSVTPVGVGCPGTGGLAPVLSTTQSPYLGNLGFYVDVTSGLPFAPSYLFASLGLSASPIGVGGNCLVYLDFGTLLALIGAGLTPTGPVFLDFAGAAQIPFPIYPIAGLLGQHVGVQVAIIDAGSSTSFTLTNALDLLVY
jgi:hypothetical protein